MLKSTTFYLLSFLFVLAGMLLAGEKTPVTVENIYERSELWPFNVSIASEKDDQLLGGGFPGILLRIEDGGKIALIDYGRDGLHRVPVEDTDLIENANKIDDGRLAKDFPNFVRYTTNMFATRKMGQKNMRPIDPDTLAGYEKILLIYCNESVFADDNFRASYKELQRDLKFVIPLMVPTRISFYKELAEQKGWDNFNIMLPHLSIAHLKLFGNDPALESGLTFILIDPEGKIYKKWRSDDSVNLAKILEKVIRELSAKQAPSKY